VKGEGTGGPKGRSGLPRFPATDSCAISRRRSLLDYHRAAVALDQTLESLVRERLRNSAFASWMGITLVGIGDGESELRLDLEPHHLNPGGIVHGGVLATLLDGCIGLALRTKLGLDSEHVTIDLNVHYLAPARAGSLTGRGKAVRTGGRISYGEAQLFTDDGTLVARGAATFLVITRSWAQEKQMGGDA
jgi:uncharacterized protein (TIGR00369 family)